jgi:hypothetical protein
MYEEICRSAGRPDAVEPALREALAEALAMANKDLRPESSFRTASFATERLATWKVERDPGAALDFAEQSVRYAERARSIPGAGPFTILRLAQARGEAALLYGRVGEERHDAALEARARALAEQSVAALGELTESQMGNWPRESRDRVRALAGR